jgi:hypothetical protein
VIPNVTRQHYSDFNPTTGDHSQELGAATPGWAAAAPESMARGGSNANAPLNRTAERIAKLGLTAIAVSAAS